MGQGSACVKQWCEKEKESGPAQEDFVFNLWTKKNRATRASCYLMIPGLLAQTYNMKDVKHQATIPYI